MTDQCECPICMDVIDITKNCVTTDCGHKFHCSCLMQNAAHNGFGCPFCRTAMAEEPQDSDDEEDDGRDSFGWETDDDEEQETTPEDEEDYVLRGLRFMTDQLEVNGWHEWDDIHAEVTYVTRRNTQVQQNQELEQRERDDASFITQGLLREGVTTEMLVMCLLGGCHDEYIQSKQFDRIDRSVFGKIRRLINIRENNRETQSEPSDSPTPDEATPGEATPVQSEQPANPPPIVRERSVAEPKIPVTPVRLLDSFNECLAE